MPQHDFVIDNGPGLAVRTDINAAFAALVAQNSGPVEPTTKYPGQFWLDTTVAPDGLLRMRNQANTGWVTPTVQPATAGNQTVTVLISSGTWTKPAGLRFLEIFVVGGGGGGSRFGVTGAGVSSAGGGGGGGGVVYELYAAAALNATEAYTVGAAGAASGGVGGAGGSSVFKGLTAGGGGGGGALMTGTASVATSVAGAGGTAGGGKLNLVGQAGTQAIVNMTGAGGLGRNGGGGSNHFASGRPSTFSSGPLTTTGSTGIFPGGGASGDWAGPNQTPGAGNVGGAGAIIIKEIF